jgi:hypothetical protein
MRDQYRCRGGWEERLQRRSQPEETHGAGSLAIEPEQELGFRRIRSRHVADRRLANLTPSVRKSEAAK